jgi:hypothetical protein
MHCPHCNQEHADDSLFCPVTGGKIDRQAFCPACGRPVDPAWQHCSVCGRDLSPVEPQPARPAVTPRPAGTKSRSPIVLILALVGAAGSISPPSTTSMP